MMEQRKVAQLNVLFEKMVSNAANTIERHELNNLYLEFINDGREDNLHKSVNSSSMPRSAIS